MKVMTVIGTRPEIIRLSEVIKKNDKYFDHILVHTGQNWDYNLNEIFFEDLNIRKPDFYLDSPGKNLGETMGNIISRSFDLFEKVRPDALLILGDTNSALCSISAKRLKIPIFHMEAGNRCFDQNVPEEINRKIVDHISDVNLPYTEHGRRNLLDEGLNKEFVFVTGSPMTEVIEKNKKSIENSKILEKLKIKEKQYIVLSVHREENIDNTKNLNSIIDSINSLAEEFKLQIIFTTHPRTLKIIEEKSIKFNKLVKSIEPLNFSDYIKIQKKSFCVVSDSGTLSEESSTLNFPSVLFRTSTERPEAVDKGSILVGNITPQSIINSVKIAVDTSIEFLSEPSNYIDKNISDKVVRIIQGFTKKIDQEIWRK